MSQIHSAMLISDWLVWSLTAIIVIAIIYMHSQPHLREPWQQVLRSPLNMVVCVILMAFTVVGLLDSVHVRVTFTDAQTQYQTNREMSLLDLAVYPLDDQDEQTYSAPFATHLYSKSTIIGADGTEQRDYARLKFGGAHLQNPADRAQDINNRIAKGAAIGIGLFLAVFFLTTFIASLWHKQSLREVLQHFVHGRTELAWRAAVTTVFCIILIIAILAQLATHYHIFGTDKVGQDVFYESVSSIRTGLLIGTLTTLFTLPFALVLGTMAGFFGGVIDDIIQYLYTTLSSIPGVLLISAAILVMQVYISNHPNLFPTLAQRADARLLALCLILGVTSWASLCRLLRGETLKLRELEYIQAARALGVRSLPIIFRHIMPNVMHIILITLVLDFSGLVLAEAVLSYVGVGVDPTTVSWGNMINSSRLELAREPMVWWPLLAALIFMFLLVLSANLFADAVRDAFDPRLRERS